MTMPLSFAALRMLIVSAVVVITAGASLSVPDTKPPAGGASGKFVDHQGLVLSDVRLDLIYWGSAWSSAHGAGPKPDQITAAMRTMTSGPYLAGLAEYRDIGRGTVRGSTMVKTPEPANGFTPDHVKRFLDAQLDAGTVAAPDAQTLYAVVLPPGVASKGAFGGMHTYYIRNGRSVHYLWVTESRTLDSVTRILSHEVVESMTDPQGSGIVGVEGTCDQEGWCEIADICWESAKVDGVLVASYWSNRTGRCVAPGAPPSTVDERT